MTAFSTQIVINREVWNHLFTNGELSNHHKCHNCAVRCDCFVRDWKGDYIVQALYRASVTYSCCVHSLQCTQYILVDIFYWNTLGTHSGNILSTVTRMLIECLCLFDDNMLLMLADIPPTLVNILYLGEVKITVLFATNSNSVATT